MKAAPKPSPTLRLRLFGPFEARLGDAPAALTIRKTVALVAYLALEGRTARARLAALLWPDADDDAARRNLRRELFRLREAGLQSALAADDEAVALDGARSDAADFDAALRESRDADADALHRAPLLEAFTLEGCDAFNEWLEMRRAACARQWRQALARHAEALERRGALRDALAAHLRLLADDALQELHFRHAMRLHQALGERSLALAQYERCRRVLRDELGIAPLDETVALGEAIRRDVQAVAPQAAASRADSAGVGPLHAPLVGRAATLAQLAAADGPALLLVGDPGVGKSRLLQAHAAGLPQALWLRCTLLSSATPLYPLAEAMRHYLASAPGALASLAPAWRRELARLLPELDTRRAAAQAADAGDRARFVEALVHALAALAGAAGSVIVDDLQWADAATLEVLAQLARRRAGKGAGNGAGDGAVWPRIVAAARPIDAGQHPAAAAFVAELDPAQALRRVVLAPLSVAQVGELVRALSGATGGERFAARLARATGGNPFYLLETIRFLFERNEIALDPQGGWRTRYDASTADYAELAVPPSVRDAVLFRVARLGAAAERLLDAAALDDADFLLDDIASAGALSEWEAVQAIEAALSGQFVERSGGAYRFAHELVRSALRARIGPERARLIHRRLARALIARHAPPASVATHLREAGEAAEAAGWWLKAAVAAAARFAYDDALRHAEAALAAGDATVRIGAHEQLALAHRAQGRHAEQAAAIDAIDALLAAHPDAGRQRRTQRLRALWLKDIGDVGEAYAIECALLAEGCSDRAEEAELLRGTGFGALYLGREADAAERLARAIPLAAEFRPDHLSPTWAVLAMAQLLLGDADAAEASLQQALALASPEDAVQRADALNYGASIAEARGELALALERCREARRFAEVSGNLPRVAAFLANEVVFLCNGGRAAEAAAAHARLVELIGSRESGLARYMVASTAARVAYAAGALGEALDRAEAARALAAQMSSSTHRDAITLLLARWTSLLGDHAGAAELAAELAAQGEAPLLAAETVLAAGDVARGEAAAALARLTRALAGPQRSDHDRHQHADLAACVLGAARVAAGEPDAAVAAVAKVRFSPNLRALALAVRLRAGACGAAEAAEADALRASGQLSPLDALRLEQAFAEVLRSAEAARRARHLHAALDASLAGHPGARAALRASVADLPD